MKKIRILIALVFSMALVSGNAQHDHDHHDHDNHDHAAHAQHDDHEGHGSGHCSFHATEGEYDPGATAFHHISDQNIFSIGPIGIPLPCILYAKGEGWSVFSSSKFEYDGHGMGHKAHAGYVLHGGSVKKVKDPSFPKETMSIDGFSHDAEGHATVCYEGKQYPLDAKSTADGGLFGGGITSFYDFSLTKNVVTMLLVLLFFWWVFTSIARKYKNNPNSAPSGIQGFFEPIIVFLQDEVAIPFLGDKYMKYLPFLLSLFFFILGLNLIGQVPFLGGSNVSGNLAVTAVLAIFAFIVTNFSGNSHYWQHVFNMPGVPAWVKFPIITPVEILGLFIKPITLALRLFANITAGHMVIIIFVSFIFIFGKSGESMGGAIGASIPTILLTLFMMAIELLVAFIQAFVFTILTASYIGAAIEDGHHEEAH